MSRAFRRTLQGVLIFPLFVYLLLPNFGAVWHSVVPEHEHLFMQSAAVADAAAAQSHAHVSADVCAACRSLSLAPLQTVIHAFDPVSALQVFGIIAGVGALWLLVAPRGLSMRLHFPALFLQAPLLLPLDPPPAA